MKKVLVTWYGITDLRASLGIEYTTGPILSALKAEKYTDVLILGYTNKDKETFKSNIFENDLVNAQNNFKNNNQTEVWSFINKYSNTELAHAHFVDWIKSQLSNEHQSIDVNFHSVELAHLNDTEGIYNIATKALDIIASWDVDKEVYFYLSPGTPVMAFVWAFVALRQPKLKKKLLVSPIASKKPEVIDLPKEWLEWHSKQIDISDALNEEYDIIFHLFGEQRMPSLLGVLQFSSKKHVFISSELYPAKVMKKFIGNSNFNELKVDPFSPMDVKDKILNYLKKSSYKKVGFNLTGGTKLMYAGALSVSKMINGIPFYFDIIHDKVIFLDDYNTENIKPITSVATFITLHSDDLFISKKGLWESIPGINIKDRKKLTYSLWKNRSKISKLYYEIANNYADKDLPFNIKKGNIEIEYSKNKNVSISIGKESFNYKNFLNFGKYITGGWFEEYMYMLLEPLVKEKIIYDLRIGLEISIKNKTSQNNSSKLENLKNIFGDTYQELDIVFTDGKKLYIVECKAGNVKSEQIMKLQNITKYFGGLKGEGILTACFPANSKVVKRKVDDAKNIVMISGENLKMGLKELFG